MNNFLCRMRDALALLLYAGRDCRAVGIPQRTVADVLADSEELPDSLKPAASHLTDFQVPLYKVWKKQEKTPDRRSSAASSKHAGKLDAVRL